MLLVWHLNALLEDDYGFGGNKWEAKRRTWKTTREVLQELREKREEELEEEYEIQVKPVQLWPEPVDDWMKRKTAVQFLLEKRKTLKRKRLVAGIILLDE